MEERSTRKVGCDGGLPILRDTGRKASGDAIGFIIHAICTDFDVCRCVIRPVI